MTTHEKLFEHLGPLASPRVLNVTKARAVTELLQAGELLTARFIEARQNDDSSTIVIEVDVEVGQQPRHDIQRCERLAIIFYLADNSWPEVLALRSDFPQNIPHLNLRPKEWPPSLCLSDQPYSEAKRRWTPIGFIELIRSWLSDTARNELHRDDQPLEPLLIDFEGHLIIPNKLLREDGNTPRPLYGYPISDPPKSCLRKPVYRLFEEPAGDSKQLPRLATAVFIAPPRQHGVIHHAPNTLAELIALTKSQGFDLLTLLKERLRVWRDTKEILDAYLVIVLCFPVVRAAGGEPESRELWAFFINKTIRKLGENFGIWEDYDGNLGLLLDGSSPKEIDDIGVGILNPHPTFSRKSAANLNRLDNAETPRILAVGAGALGSQVITSLTRQGWGAWTIIDNDVLFPHNLARHALTSDVLGYPKAVGLAHNLRHIIDEEPAPDYLVVDILVPSAEENERLTKVMDEAELIIDMSASVAVARHLSNAEIPARRFSAFLNPSGTDLVLLAEDKRRAFSLNELEMHYYWALATNDQFRNHLDAPDRVRYARSCRDLSSRVSQTGVTIYAGVASEAIRRAFKHDSPLISIWQMDTIDCTIRCHTISAQPMCKFELNGWNISVNRELFQQLGQWRSDKLPNETGGVLLGDCDIEHSHIYLMGAFDAPPDSEEWPTHYIRGSRGLQKQVKRVIDRTDGMLRYMGEWHSHPDGAACSPSADDYRSYAWLSDHMHSEGYPPIMLIAGEGGEFYFLLGDKGTTLIHEQHHL